MRLRARLVPRIRRICGIVDRRAPAIARVARPIWRKVTGGLIPLGYWEQRSEYAYYRVVAELAQRYVPMGHAVLDVGARDTQTLLALDWFPQRVALDLQRGPSLPGVERIVADFRRWEPPIRFDLVLCLQVLEHLEDPPGFIRKLRGAGRVVIVSVPYRWPQGLHPEHVQVPVDEKKLHGWAGRQPLETRLVMDERERLIAVFDGTERE